LRTEQRGSAIEDIKREAQAHPEQAIVVPEKKAGTRIRNH